MESGDSRTVSKTDGTEGPQNSSERATPGGGEDAPGGEADDGHRTADRERELEESGPVLDLFGVIHFDRRGKVIRELDEVAAESEALCIEATEEGFHVRAFLRSLVRTPLYLIGFFTLFLLVQGPMFVLFNRDVVPTEILASAAIADGRPVHRVDDIEKRLLLEAGWPVVVSNWVLYGLLAYLNPLGAVVTTGLVVVGSLGVYAIRHAGYRWPSVFAVMGVWAIAGAAVLGGYLSAWLLLGGILTMAILATKGISGRNDHMLERVESVAAEHGYDRVTLVTGRAHLDGLIRDSSTFGTSLGTGHWSRWLRTGKTDLEPAPSEVDDDSESGESIRSHAKRRRQRRSELHVAGELGTEDEVLPRRILAGLVDVFGIGLFTGATAVLTAALSTVLYLLALPFGPDGLTAGTAVLIGAFAAIPFGPVLYFPTLEIQYGRTLGKLATGLVVVQSDGSGCTTSSGLLRNLFRPVDAVLLLGLPLMLATDRCQRLGDLVADTVVVRAEG